MSTIVLNFVPQNDAEGEMILLTKIKFLMLKQFILKETNVVILFIELLDRRQYLFKSTCV